jgi:KinB signaling pathway activation protein
VFLRVYLAAVFWVLISSGLGQLFMPREVAAGSVWGFAPGWQREIGIFDLALGLIVLRALKAGEPRFRRNVALAIVVLTTLIGTNHLVAVLSERPAWVHVVFTVVNFAIAAFGCAAMISGRGAERTARSRATR